MIFTHINRNSLKIIVEGQFTVKLYPENDEPVNILNVKRGIFSALMAPIMEEEMNKEMVFALPVYWLFLFCQYIGTNQLRPKLPSRVWLIVEKSHAKINKLHNE